ncbi:preprotein translocase subunit TatA [Photobacterium jeanii]|uniref:Sec-independent protein translocase protein TatA n=1 Tax=Photobacterium jeanii TaxID=858640 RepID=A0A178KLD6_9GAMM|nr:preprotein translocase subunit TatA [Photobacterium jeanii]PST92529.1 twin-arginine translocase TatA/TatE family subunit [Photobacterium jeanii]
MAGISIWQLAIIAIIVALLFGTKRLRTLGGDVGTAINGFKSAMKDDNDKKPTSDVAIQPRDEAKS